MKTVFTAITLYLQIRSLMDLPNPIHLARPALFLLLHPLDLLLDLLNALEVVDRLDAELGCRIVVRNDEGPRMQLDRTDRPKVVDAFLDALGQCERFPAPGDENDCGQRVRHSDKICYDYEGASRISRASSTVATPTVSAIFGTLLMSLSKNRACSRVSAWGSPAQTSPRTFASIVSIARVLILVRLASELPGSLNAMCPSSPMPPRNSSMPPSSLILASYRTHSAWREGAVPSRMLMLEGGMSTARKRSGRNVSYGTRRKANVAETDCG